MSKRQGLTQGEIDGSLTAMALVEAALVCDDATMGDLFALAKEQPEGVTAALVSSLAQLLHASCGDDAVKQVQHWRARILEQVPTS